MPYRHRLQARRFELKYILSERCARAVADFVRGYLEPDQHTRGSSNFSYSVYSLYLDTPTLALFRQTCQGVKNRFKLRMRFYDADPAHPVFLEVKRREADVICKERAAVTREGAERLLRGERPGAPHRIGGTDGPGGPSALECFCRLRDEVEARGAAYVAYTREAYVSPKNDRLRITFDRDVRGTAFDRRRQLEPPQNGTRAKVGGVILEIKFTDCFPGWLLDMVQAFDLQRQSVPKYVLCVRALGLRPSRWLGVEQEFVA